MNEDLLNAFLIKYSYYNSLKMKDIDSIPKDKLDELLKMQLKIEKKIKKYDIKRRISLYYIFGMLKKDEVQSLLLEKEYIKSRIWQVVDYKEEDIEFVKDKSLESISYCENVLELYKDDLDLKPVFEDAKNLIRRSYQTMAYLYYIINNNEEFLKYSAYAVEYNSIGAASTLVKYYCDEDNYNEAYKYFKICIDLKYDDSDPNNNIVFENDKIMSYSYFYHYLFNKGLFDEAKDIAFKLKGFISGKPYEYQYNNVVIEFIKKCNKYIELSKENIKNSKNMKLNDFFSEDIIKLMNNNIKIYINTSLEIYSYLVSVDEIMDYSAALMPIMKAVESILYEIIVKNYLAFLKTKKYSLTSLPKFFKDKEKGIKEHIDRIEYGDALNAISKYDKSTDTHMVNNDFLSFCIANKVNDSENIIRKFALILYSLKEKRNKVAHKERIFKEDADWCKELLLENTKFIEFLYQNYSFCFKNDFSSYY